jgi:hypothetical protein
VIEGTKKSAHKFKAMRARNFWGGVPLAKQLRVTPWEVAGKLSAYLNKLELYSTNPYRKATCQGLEAVGP